MGASYIRIQGRNRYDSRFVLHTGLPDVLQQIRRSVALPVNHEQVSAPFGQHAKGMGRAQAEICTNRQISQQAIHSRKHRRITANEQALKGHIRCHVSLQVRERVCRRAPPQTFSSRES